jgi:hypothetical protein
MQYSFGSGVLFGRTLVSNVPTPVRFGALQGVTVDMQFTTKELYGQFQFPLALGRGTGKITCKADFAQVNAQAYNDLFFGLSNPSDGTVRTVVGEAKTITANAATVTYNSSFSDLGVVRASDGAVYTRVAATPAGLQYTVSNVGVYTFNASQNAVPVLLSYTYADAANGKTISITNQLLGNSPQFMAAFTETFNGKALTLVLNACMSSKLSLATKLEDFTIPSFDFMAFADAAGAIGSLSTDE